MKATHLYIYGSISILILLSIGMFILLDGSFDRKYVTSKDYTLKMNKEELVFRINQFYRLNPKFEDSSTITYTHCIYFNIPVSWSKERIVIDSRIAGGSDYLKYYIIQNHKEYPLNDIDSNSSIIQFRFVNFYTEDESSEIYNEIEKIVYKIKAVKQVPVDSLMNYELLLENSNSPWSHCYLIKSKI